MDIHLQEGENSTKISQLMEDKEEIWNKMIEKYQLKENKLNEICNWKFIDMVLSRDYSLVSSMNKTRKYGILDYTDSEEMFISFLKQLQQDGIIPTEFL